MGRDGGALINYQGLNGGLMVQVCCRCIVAFEDRAAFTPMRIHDTDPPQLKEAQTLLNTLIEAKRDFVQAEGEMVGRWLTAGHSWLEAAGFSNYALTLKDFMNDSKAPFKGGRLRD